jgi:serine/threonine protein kinase
MVELLGKLNSLVPPLGEKLGLYPTDRSVQLPLQHIFGAYMDALLGILRRLTFTPSGKTRSPPAAKLASLANIVEEGDFDLIQSIQTCIEETENKFEMGKSTFEQNMELAIRTQSYGSHNPPYTFPNPPRDSNVNFLESHTRYKPVRRLGWGSFGEVFAVEEASTKDRYARKYISLRTHGSASGAREEDVLNEVRIMRALVHQHIAQVTNCIREYEPDAYVIIIHPAGDCDLRKYLEVCSETNFLQTDISNILPWFGCLLDALAFAHRNKIWHRDIKPSNIIIKGLKIFLADFGLARDFTEYETSKTSNNATCGTLVYRAPEVKPGNPRGSQADVFSLGCVFSEMFSVYCRRSLAEYQQARCVPMVSSENGSVAFRDALQNVDDWLHRLQKNARDAVSNVLIIQMSQMLRENPDHRPTAQVGVETLRSQRGSLFCDAH